MGYGGNGGHAARPPALFVLELGANGGTLAPTSVDDLLMWVQTEVLAWQWLSQVRNQSLTNLKVALEWALKPLTQADSAIRTVIASIGKSSDKTIEVHLHKIQSFLQDAFVRRCLPHTASPLGNRLANLNSDPAVALGYTFGVVASEHQQLITQGDANVWRGFLMGLQDRYGVITDVDARLTNEKEALSDLRTKAEEAITQRGLAADDLHRRYEALVAGIVETDAQQKQDFQALLSSVNEKHEKAQDTYESDMNDLRRAFKEAMALRGPVNYWRRKARKHRVQAKRQMVQSFKSLGGLAIGLGLTAIWAFWKVNDKGVPDAWKISVLILMSVLGIWAVRLVIRMWLSSAHLATDAEERVTMVQTYLALIEDGKMTKDEDRALVLTPLFRPAADGLVKDEGLPHPMLEMLTRSGRN